MDTQKIIRAWKDPTYRASLTADERALLPENPSGGALAELDETELEGVVGGCPKPTFGPQCPPKKTFDYCPTKAIGIAYCPDKVSQRL
jgi:mersacidin/lichenicidin family type 2 lantibiotic